MPDLQRQRYAEVFGRLKKKSVHLTATEVLRDGRQTPNIVHANAFSVQPISNLVNKLIDLGKIILDVIL